MGDITKLPKWAQEEISKLESDVKYWQTKYKTFDGQMKTRIQVDGRFNKDTDTYLPEHSTVSFKLKEDDVPFRAIDVTIVKGVLRIYADDMVVLPVASNSIYIKQARLKD